MISHNLILMCVQLKRKFTTARLTLTIYKFVVLSFAGNDPIHLIVISMSYSVHRTFECTNKIKTFEKVLKDLYEWYASYKFS